MEVMCQVSNVSDMLMSKKMILKQSINNKVHPLPLITAIAPKQIKAIFSCGKRATSGSSSWNIEKKLLW
jgi:hypothetical protein